MFCSLFSIPQSWSRLWRHPRSANRRTVYMKMNIRVVRKAIALKSEGNLQIKKAKNNPRSAVCDEESESRDGEEKCSMKGESTLKKRVKRSSTQVAQSAATISISECLRPTEKLSGAIKRPFRRMAWNCTSISAAIRALAAELWEVRGKTPLTAHFSYDDGKIIFFVVMDQLK